MSDVKVIRFLKANYAIMSVMWLDEQCHISDTI